MSEAKEAVSRYRKFHGRSPSKASKVFIPHPNAVVLLGEAVAIEYRSDKRAPSLGDRAGGKKVLRTYRHKFGKGVKVFTDPKGTCLIVTGGRLKVTDWLRY